MTKAGSAKLKARKNMAEMLLFQTAKWPELDDDDAGHDGDDGLPPLPPFGNDECPTRPGPGPGQSSRAHIPRPQRVQRANEIGKYALATRKENMSSRTDGEMKNSQAEAEARTI